MIIMISAITLIVRVRGDSPTISSSAHTVELPCPPPSKIENGVEQWEINSNVVRFACYQGYHLVGPPMLECRYGTWYSDESEIQPTCKPIVCGMPKIENGQLSTGDSVRYELAQQAVVVCNSGYELLVSVMNKVVCKEDGTWGALIGDFPVCKEKSCFYPDENTLPSLENGGIEINRVPKIKDDTVKAIEYEPGAVAVYHCTASFVLVPLSAATRVCRLGRWEGSTPANCVSQLQVKPSLRHQPNSELRCSAPLKIENGYYLTDRNSAETPLALPVAERSKRYERGTIAKYHCLRGFSMQRLHGQDSYICLDNGEWSPRIPPICIAEKESTLVNNDPLKEAMCSSPESIPHTDFTRVEGWLTSNGALDGTVLEYSCRLGYRDSRTPCIPTRRTCRSGIWVGIQPSCVAFNYCERPPIISHGFLPLPSESSYKVNDVVRYSCHAGYKMKNGMQILKCSLTGCWTPNHLPECIRKNIYEDWKDAVNGNEVTGIVEGQGGGTGVSSGIVPLLVSVIVTLIFITLLTLFYLIFVCKRQMNATGNGFRTNSAALGSGYNGSRRGPAHWSTTVTVTPDYHRAEDRNAGSEYDRMALIAFTDGVQQVTLPTYEEALRLGGQIDRSNHCCDYDREHLTSLNGPDCDDAESFVNPSLRGFTGSSVSNSRRASGQVNLSSHGWIPSVNSSFVVDRGRSGGTGVITDGPVSYSVANKKALNHVSSPASGMRNAHQRRMRVERRDEDVASQGSLFTCASDNISDSLSHNSFQLWTTAAAAASAAAVSLNREKYYCDASLSGISAGGCSSISAEDCLLTSAAGLTATSTVTATQTPSCRALAGSLASFETISSVAVMNSEGTSSIEEANRCVSVEKQQEDRSIKSLGFGDTNIL